MEYIRLGICEACQPQNKKKYFDIPVNCSCDTNVLPTRVQSISLLIGNSAQTACNGTPITGYYLSQNNLNNLNTKVYKNIHLNLYLNDGYYSWGANLSICYNVRSWFRIINGQITETVECGCNF
jgi:hypothetical protein